MTGPSAACAQDSNIQPVWLPQFPLRAVNLLGCGFPGCICSPLSSIRGPHKKANLLCRPLTQQASEPISLLTKNAGPATFSATIHLCPGISAVSILGVSSFQSRLR